MGAVSIFPVGAVKVWREEKEIYEWGRNSLLLLLQLCQRLLVRSRLGGLWRGCEGQSSIAVALWMVRGRYRWSQL